MCLDFSNGSVAELLVSRLSPHSSNGLFNTSGPFHHCESLLSSAGDWSRVNQSAVLFFPGSQAQHDISPSVAAWISPILTPSYTLNLVLVLLIMLRTVSESTSCRTFSNCNLLSLSITLLPLLDRTAALSSI